VKNYHGAKNVKDLIQLAAIKLRHVRITKNYNFFKYAVLCFTVVAKNRLVYATRSHLEMHSFPTNRTSGASA
jgi:hypothetical protein